MGKLLGIGQALWDVVAEVPVEFLDEFSIPLGDGVFISEKQDGLFEKLDELFEPSYIPGGCTQNSIGVFQALARKEDSSMLISCVGYDKYGGKLENLIRSKGTAVRFLHSTTQRTGKIAVLVTDKERAFCVALGAATEMTSDFISDHWDEIQSYECIYTTSHDFMSHGEHLLRIGKHCSTSGQLFTYNLSSVERMPVYLPISLQLLPLANVLFGNEKEFFELARLTGMAFDGTLSGVASAVVTKMALGKTANPLKMVVMTCGPSPVIVGEIGSCGIPVIHTVTVPAVAYEKIVDFNGAGDAFVGGFLYGMLHGREIKRCVEIGVYCAQDCIQRRGCTCILDDCPLVDDLDCVSVKAPRV